MIPCTDFIPAYSELFKYLERQGGEEAVLGFWNYISDEFLGNLGDLVKEHGIRGCWLYWSRTLSEEAADFELELEEARDQFRAVMYACPSKGRFLKEDSLEPYHKYCEHCDVLYNRVLQPLGYAYDIDLSECDQAKCSFVVRRKSPSSGVSD